MSKIVGEIPVIAVSTGAEGSRQVRDIGASKIHEAISGYAFCNALFVLTETKLKDDLAADGTIVASTSATRHGYDHHQTLGLLRYLSLHEFFKEEDNELFRLTPFGEAALSLGSMGFFHLYRGGYGNLMTNAAKILDRSLVYGKDIVRDGRYVALGAGEATKATLTSMVHSVLETSNARTIVDLGCGAAGFLIDFVKRSPDHRGIGVDVDAKAVDEARAAVARAGVSNQVTVVLGNAFDLASIVKECKAADLFYSFAIEHEVLRDGEQAFLGHIDRMAELFPGKRYLLGEPMNSMTREDSAFYWFHVLSHQGIPRNVAGWIPLFRKLTRAKLERVYIPDHERYGAFFDVKF